MKKRKLILPVAVLMLSAVSFQSCIGSFSLTNKVLTWNRSVSNKFVNELVFFAFWVLPVYEVTAAADLLVINSIEFWSGNKPLESNNRVIETENGKYYIAADEKGYAIKSPDGKTLNFVYDSTNQMWSFGVDDQPLMDFLKFTDENHVQILDAKGEFVDVELNEDGVANYRAAIAMPMMAAN